MADDVPDWASQPANVPQATTDAVPSWAQQANPGGQITSPGNGNLFGAGGRIDRLGHLMHGEFESAVMNGFGGLVARKGFELAGVPKEQVNAAVQKARQDAQQEIDNSGSQGFNPLGFAAGVVGSADPTWAFNPGEGVANRLAARKVTNLAARAGANAAAHAALGSMTDAAYQGADMIDGLQKTFDVKRNLTNAAMQGAFGAAHPVVSDFVTGLFKNRGIDTTPPADPRSTTTTPLTGQAPPPEFVQKYNQVLQTGNEQDIRGIFDGTNIPPPSFEDTHNFVKQRDAQAAPADYTDQLYTPPVFDQRPAVQEHIANETAAWKNAPEFEVINHTDDIQDPQVRQDAVNAGANDPSALGFLGGDGKVRIFANKIDSEDTLNSVLYHEALGHYGLAQKFGDRLDAILQTLLDRNVGQFGKDTDAWQKANPGAYDGNRLRAAEEVLANQSQNGVLKPSVADAIVSHIRNFGRRMGLKLSYSDAEISTILGMAHDAVINGKGRDVVGNGFKFMFTGPSAAGFDAEHSSSFTPSDGQPRNEISDKGSSVDEDALNSGGRYQLMDILKHPALYKEYPQLRGTEVVSMNMAHLDPGLEGWHGAYDPETRRIYVDQNAPDKLGTVLHETQHAIQHIEENPRMAGNAGNKDFSDEQYEQDPVEKEAFATQDRIGMSDTDRQANTPLFMRRSDLDPKDVAEEAYERLGQGYTPRARSWEEAQSMARDTAISPETIRNTRSVGNLDKKLFIYNNAAQEANDTLLRLAKLEASSTGLSTEEHVRGMEVAAQFSYALGRIDNDAAQIARGLNAMKAISFSRNNLLRLRDELAKTGTNLESLSDPDTMIKFLRQYAALAGSNNPNGAANLLRGVTKPYWEQYLLTWHQNMMLSGLSTHLKSVMDMATTAGRDVEEKLLALPYGLARNVANSLGANLEPGIHPTELAAHLWGMSRAALEGFSMAKGTMFRDSLDALAGRNNTPQTSGNMIPNPRIPVVSKVTDLVAAQDTFFRSILTNGNLYSLAARDAYSRMKSASPTVNWDDVLTQGAADARTPSQSLLDRAHDAVEQTILLNRNSLTSGVSSARMYRPGMSGGERAVTFSLNILAPFIRVSSNALMNQVVKRSPAAILSSAVRADLAAGGARADQALAKMIMGSALIGTYWAAADPKNNKLTGEGPDNPDKRKELEASGWAANAVHDSGRYNRNSNLNLSINPLDVHNNLATTIAGLREAYEKGTADGGHTALGIRLALAAVMHDIASQTFIGDLAPAIDAFTARGTSAPQKIGQFAADEAKTFLPNAMTQTARIADPNQHDIRDDNGIPSITKAIQSSVPGLTGGLPTKYNVYGQPIKTGTSVTGVHTWVTSGNGTNETTDPTEKELGRLAGLTKAAIITPTQSTVSVEGAKIKLTPSQQSDYQKYAGQTIVQAVRDQMQSGDWAKLSDQDKVDTIRNVQKQAKSEVRDALLQKDGWLTPTQLSNLRTQLNGQ